MNSLQRVFNYQNQEIRTVTKDGNPWFVAKDVCEFFGDTNYRRSIGRLDDDEKGVSPLNTPGGQQEMIIINEPGLYALLFHMQPQRKPSISEEQYIKRVESLKAFKRWITHEVIPAIRKTGSYSRPTYQNETLQALMEIYHETKNKMKVNDRAALFKAIAATARQPKIIFDAPIGIKLPQGRRGVSKELADEVYNYLIDWLEKNELHFRGIGEAKPKYGMAIENRAFIYPEVFRGVLEKGGYSEMTALRSLAQEALIDTEVRGGEGKRRFRIRKYDRDLRRQGSFVSLKLFL